jgi:hypothetical protein
MQIPRYCGSTEFARSLNFCQDKIGTVLVSFEAGAFVEKDLNDLISASRRVAFVCRELLRARDFKMLIEATDTDDEFDEFGWK